MIKKTFFFIFLSSFLLANSMDSNILHSGDVYEFAEKNALLLIKEHLEKNKSFDMEKYFLSIVNEFEALGIEVSLNKKSKSNETNIESAFLKNDTSIHTLNIEAKGLEDIHNGRRIKIKLEVDTNPPLKFQTESKTLLLPMTFNIRTMTLPNLYAGKMYALLFRNWITRVKGRDWFDFEWYVKNNIPLNLSFMSKNERKWKF
ncbi:nucleotidyl transferase AbiEii/AbiGii toxin family protein [Helicobacter sp. 11-8110]|uniref:nucleotidyl transferase AbiEii/AbiGii toxin family protein n=1 Tax=Helicobacter sp. 11-8110 TaxID=2004997 RepID=UPI0015EBD831|nr:nucleotidyl transferase AbiEii/AbiGii toxin family protein [Helicobacter sp. 11-8110]